jgi:hypothetical protein
MSIYDKLGFDSTFDTSKFGDALDLSEGTKQLFSIQKSNLKQWQIDDIDNDTDITYYQNPLESTLVSCNNAIKNIKTKTNTTTYHYLTSGSSDAANTLYESCNTAIETISSFLAHTNRLSGVKESANTSSYPDLDSAMNIGKKMLTLTNKTDGIEDNKPILGNFTSLYIGDYLSSNNTIISADYITLNSSIYTGNNNTFISPSAINLINSRVNTLNTLLTNRESADLTFYRNSLKISRKLSSVSKFSSIGGSQSKLIELIGTNELKSRLG